MIHRHLILAAIVPAMLVTGCAGTRNRSLYSVHQPVVGRTAYAFDVNAGPGGLAPGEAQRLAGWMASLRPGYGDDIAIDDAGNGGAAVRADVQSVATEYGLIVSNDAPVTGAPLPPGVVRVVLSRSMASVPGCPDHSRSPTPDFEAHTSSNFGCALNANLAGMVANPLDLVRGAPGTDVADPATSMRAIDSYRKAAPTGQGGTVLKQESAGGKK